MAAPSIILNYPNILVSQTISSIGVEIQSSGLIFGMIELIYDTSDKSAVGNIILFDPTKSIQMKYGSTIYYLLDENIASFTEIPSL